MKGPVFMSMVVGYVVLLVEGINFPYEAVQLTDEEIEGRPEIGFGVFPPNPLPPPDNASECRPFPGDANWPSQSQWTDLNQTLGGNLVRPEPPAQVCYAPFYDEARCAVVRYMFSFFPF